VIYSYSYGEYRLYMTQTTEIATTNDRTDLTLERHWLIVRKVFEAMAVPGVNNIRKALEYTGIAQSTFYDAIGDPAVKARTVEWIGASDRAVLARIESERFGYVENLARIAKSDSREAVAAARTLEEIKASVVKDLAADEVPGKGRHPARALLESARKATFRRTTVTEEVEIEPDDAISDGNVVDMEP